MKEFEVVIQNNLEFAGIDIWFIKNTNKNLFCVAKPLEIIFEEKEDHVRIEPTLHLSRKYAEVFLEAIQEGLLSHGIRPKEGIKMEGLYEATKYHLEDLRKLLKLVR